MIRIFNTFEPTGIVPAAETVDKRQLGIESLRGDSDYILIKEEVGPAPTIKIDNRFSSLG